MSSGDSLPQFNLDVPGRIQGGIHNFGLLSSERCSTRPANSKTNSGQTNKGLTYVQSVDAQSPPVGVIVCREEIQLLVSTLSLDRGSKLQGQSSAAFALLARVRC
ncbi:hypothetical protein TNCV_3164321 [Trichonephila clavipes]|nr:hypothetical protein TNCV_3164321 [Trichonephila clavipes]